MSFKRIKLGPFELDHIVGSGGMGEVWRGRHVAENVPVAVKVLGDDRHREEIYREAFQNEVRAVASLDHMGIVTVLDYGEVTAEAAAASDERLVEGSPYLVMELARRGSLMRYRSTMAWEEYKVVLFAVLDALAHAHASGVLHRDLKPANVLVGCGDAHPGIKLTDFGLAHALENDAPDEMTRHGWGTPHYMSPEQFRGDWRSFGPWTDLYSFGVMAFELAVGEHPYDADTSAGFARAHTMLDPKPFTPRFPTPKGFDFWLLTLLQKDIRNRFQRAADAAYALQRLGDPDKGSKTFKLMPVGVEASDDPTVPPSSLLDPPAGFEQSDMDSSTADTIADVAPITQLEEGSAPRLKTESLQVSDWEDTDPERTTLLDMAARSIDRRVPPLPWTWKRPVSRRVDRTLLGAGLGLFGLSRIPIVGREQERDEIWEALKRVRETRRAHAVILTGPAGTGKSRLASWLIRRAHEVGSAEPFYAFNGPMLPASEAIRRMLAVHFRSSGLQGDELTKFLSRAIEQSSESPNVEAEALGRLVADPSLGSKEATSVMMAPEQRQGLIRRQLARASAKRPAIVWLDDVQWGSESLLLASAILQADDPPPVLLVLTARSEALAARPYEHAIVRQLATRPDVRVLRLQPLSDDDSDALVHQILHLSGDLAQEVSRRSDGNPLFAVQLVGDWVAGGKLQVGPKGFELRPGAQVDIPDDIYKVWSERLATVLASADERLLLEVAAALGQRVSPHEWRTACEKYGTPVPPGFLQKVMLAGLIEAADDEWSFVHGMLRESLETSAKRGGRWRAINLACADMIDARYGASGYPNVERRALHLVEAERLGSAIEPLLAAAAHRIARSEFETAEELLSTRESALIEVGVEPERPSWGEGWILRAELLNQQGQFPKAFELGERVFVEARRQGWTELIGRSLLAQGKAELHSGRLDAAQRLFERARTQFDTRSDRQGEASALEGMARVAQFRGELGAAEKLFRDAYAVFDSLSNGLGVARCINGLGDVARRDGRFDEARDLANDAMSRAKKMNNPLGVADATNDLAELLRLEGDFKAAEAKCREAMQLYESLGSDHAMEVRANLGQAIVELGRFGEAKQMFDEVLRHAREARDDAMIARASVALLAPAAFLGDWDLWRERFDEANRLVLRLRMHDVNIARAADLASRVAAQADRHELAAEAVALRDEQQAGIRSA